MKNILKIAAMLLLFVGVTFATHPLPVQKEVHDVTIVTQTNDFSIVAIATNAVCEAIGYLENHNPFSKEDTVPPTAIFSCVALTGIRRKCGPKPGGNKRLYICPVENFQDVEFPTYEMAVAGEITDPIPLITTPTAKKFIEIQAAYDTTKWGFASKGKSGNQAFEQNIMFDYYGVDKDSISLVAKLLNNPCVIIARGNNNTNYFVGSVDVPLEFEVQANSGGKGTDPQKITFSAKNDGFMFPVIPLNATATFAVEPLPAAV